MQICSNYSPNIFSSIFITIEYIIIIILLLLFIKKIYELYKFPNSSYEQIDIIIIYLSSLQLYENDNLIGTVNQSITTNSMELRLETGSNRFTELKDFKIKPL